MTTTTTTTTPPQQKHCDNNNTDDNNNNNNNNKVVSGRYLGDGSPAVSGGDGVAHPLLAGPGVLRAAATPAVHRLSLPAPARTSQTPGEPHLGYTGLRVSQVTIKASGCKGHDQRWLTLYRGVHRHGNTPNPLRSRLG